MNPDRLPTLPERLYCEMLTRDVSDRSFNQHSRRLAVLRRNVLPVPHGQGRLPRGAESQRLEKDSQASSRGHLRH